MPRRNVIVIPDDERTRTALDELGDSLDLPGSYPQDAIDSVVSDPPLPDLDLTDIPFETVDPPGAKDLDQAVHVERIDDGFLVHYAIADVGRHVVPGSPLDIETWNRGATLYGPDRNVPLHPPTLVEAASLLPDQLRAANVWEIRLDGEARPTDVSLRSAQVRSIRRRDYEEVQGLLDTGDGPNLWRHVLEVGGMRRQLEIERGGVSLPIPDQEVYTTNGGYGLRWEGARPIDGANAQISLLTGAVAAQMMIDHGVGILRTLPEASQHSTDRLRHVAKGLGIPWSGREPYGEMLRRLDPTIPEHLAMMSESTTLFRGAGYQVVGDGQPRKHGALNLHYTHTTAPLRRLVDRYTGAICVALTVGENPPEWAVERLDQLPAVMADGDRRAGAYERAGLDLVEALLLEDRIGERFQAMVVDEYERGGSIVIQDPPLETKVDFPVELGKRVEVELTAVDVSKQRISFKTT